MKLLVLLHGTITECLKQIDGFVNKNFLLMEEENYLFWLKLNKMPRRIFGPKRRGNRKMGNIA
jgi:hypothetical protein